MPNCDNDEGFKADFDNKPVVDYKLSHTFRFGPMMAQAAYNVISFNQGREMKPLMSHFVEKDTSITVLLDMSEQATDTAKSMAEEVDTLVRRRQVPPNEIAVLGRTFVQIEGLQGMFVQKRIPFRVLGMGPFFERDENRTLIDYVRLALALDDRPEVMKPWRPSRSGRDEEDSAQSKAPEAYQRIPSFKGKLAGEAVRTVLAVANTPSRKLARIQLQRAIEQGAQKGWTIGQSLNQLLDERLSTLPAERHEAMQELLDMLTRIRERVTHEPELKAVDLLEWIVDSTAYREHFSRYYGNGMASVERLLSVDNFLRFVRALGKSTQELIAYLRTLDPTLGLPPEKVITMTTVHRTKGLQFRYVLIPACVEGNMPVLFADDAAIYDTAGVVPNHPPSSPIEQERRLFYVAITRAIDHLYVGTIIPPEAGLQLASSSPLPSRFLEEWQYEQSKPIIDALQAAWVSNEPEVGQTRSNLERVLVQQAGHRSVVSFVAEHYLHQLGDDAMINRVTQVLATVPEKPFEYSYQYPDWEAPGKPNQEEPTPPPWSDPWDGIGATI